MQVEDAELEFECPECGGNIFGTYALGVGGSTTVLQCEGECDTGYESFRWSEEDDWKYFKLVTKQTPESKEEYLRVWREHHE